jgi:hypothetical protein
LVNAFVGKSCHESWSAKIEMVTGFAAGSEELPAEASDDGLAAEFPFWSAWPPLEQPVTVKTIAIRTAAAKLTIFFKLNLSLF